MLHRYLLPIVYKIHDTIGDPLFQQDNAPIHMAGRVMTSFENHINLLTHPPYSPDLNPIEHAWVLLKRQLIDYPDIGDTPGGPPAGKARLAQVLPRVWDNIPRKRFEALWKSMSAPVEAVIDAKGCYTQLSRCGDVALYLGTGRGGACRCFHDQVHHPVCTGARSYSTTTHCKNFLSLASPFLLCCNTSIFFSHYIFFSLLCCHRLCRWHCSRSTFSIYSVFGLVTHYTLFQFTCYHRYRLYSNLIISNLILYCTEAVVG